MFAAKALRLRYSLQATAFLHHLFLPSYRPRRFPRCHLSFPCRTLAVASHGLSIGLPPLVYDKNYSIPWPSTHRFVMAKFHHILTLGMESGIIDPHFIHKPDALQTSLITAAHCPRYVQQFRDGTMPKGSMRRIGFEWSKELVERTVLECAGTVTAARIALEKGMACNLAGGTHHAYR